MRLVRNRARQSRRGRLSQQPFKIAAVLDEPDAQQSFSASDPDSRLLKGQRGTGGKERRLRDNQCALEVPCMALELRRDVSGVSKKL